MVNLISVFNDTKKHCNNDTELIQAIDNTIQNQYIVAEEETVDVANGHRFDKAAEITVSTKRSFQAAEAYKGEKMCVLNFASSRHPGGGVVTGATAQEECLCRCSTLYFAISEQNTVKNFHQKHDTAVKQKKMDLLYNADCIFSPDIVVLKSDDGKYTLLPEKERYNVDIITCAAPNLTFVSKSIADKNTRINYDKLKALHKARAKRILDIAKANQEDVLILGAFGCGAFRNPPQVVAQAWSEVLKDYLYDFKKIEFAVYCKPDKPSKNYTAFKEVIEKNF